MPRKSVERDVTEFCGWDRLLGIADKIGRIKTPYPPEMLQALVAALFETGGRVSEVLGLKPRNFDLARDPEFVVVKGMPVLKRKKSLGGVTSRTFPIKRSDPLWPALERWIKGGKADEPLFRISRSKVWGILREVDRSIYPHWFRAQRASQLAYDHGWGIGELIEFFAWRDTKTALRYAHHGFKGLAERMR